MLEHARNTVLDSGDWRAATDWVEFVGLGSTSVGAQLEEWSTQGQIFAICQGGVDYYPGYALDRSPHLRPFKAMALVLDVFAGHKNGWGLAFWFSSVNSFLGGKRPQDVLAIDPERVIAAARDEVAGVVHG